MERDDDTDDAEQNDEREITPVEAKFVLPDGHYYGRTVPGGPWHIFDDEERRSLCGIYNDEGVTRGENRGVYRGSLPDGVCGSCVGNAPYLELVREAEDEEETVEVHGSEVPKQLAEFYRDDLSGLIAVNPDAPDGVLVYDSAGRVGGRPAVEIPHSDPHLVDESDVPGGTTPPMSFADLVRKYGLAFEVVDGYTYVYVPERED